MKPLEIVGGGLSGLSLGIALRKKGVPVTIWEAGNYPRHRVCGEFICGVRPSTLEQLGIADILADAQKLQTASWHLNDERVFDINLPSAAMGLSRYTLDLRLAERFEKLGGTLRQGERFRAKEQAPTGTVWAAGRVPAKTDLLGLKMHLKDFQMEDDLEMHFSKGGYAGVSWVEDGRANICALLKKNPAVKAPRQELFVAYFRACGLHKLASRLEAGAIDHDSHCAISSVPSGYLRSAKNEGPCAIGDHFGMMGPFTGNGMSMAFESSAVAISPLIEYAEGVRDWPETIGRVHDVQRDRFGNRLRLSHGIHNLVLNPIGLRSLAVLGRWKALPFDFLFRKLR